MIIEQFLINAFIGGLLASLACGIIGPFVVVRRIGYIAGGISHTVLGGMGVAYFLGAEPLYGAVVAAILSALLIGFVGLKAKVDEDTIISALWASGMAVGIIFISQTPGYSTDLMSYLFGNILMVSPERLYLIAALDVVILATVLVFFRQFVAVIFDQEFSRLRGIPVDFFYLLLLCLVALTAVILVQVVGLILVIALLTLPAAIAGRLFRSLIGMIGGAIIFGALFSTLGLGISYVTDFPAGAVIILVSVFFYLLVVVAKGRAQKIMRRFT